MNSNIWFITIIFVKLNVVLIWYVNSVIMSDNPERVSFPFNLGGPGTLTADKQFSIYVSRTLDFIGKNQNMVKFRVKMYRSNILELYECIVTGSKSEGLTSCNESDGDCMIVLPNVISADNVRPFLHNRNITVLKTDRYSSHAGYTKLKLVNYFHQFSSILTDYAFVEDESGDKYMSSDNFIQRLTQLRPKGPDIYYERSGPSLPMSDRYGYMHKDTVHALRCVCPTLLQSFLTRPRPYNRPSCNELRDISEMEAHVVPVGHKRSNASHLEWRICFTKAEIYLVQRLNDTESKLYILLKLISKLCKKVSKDITSYVMKNIVLWMVEIYPADLFIEELLTHRLLQAMRFLLKCIEVNYLPSYMIPERNLLADRPGNLQDFELITFLSTLIQEGGYLLLRCEKLRYGMTILYREPDMAAEFQKRRDMVEKLWLLHGRINGEYIDTLGLSEEEVTRLRDNDGSAIKIHTAIMKIICPELMILLRLGCRRSALAYLCFERQRQMLS